MGNVNDVGKKKQINVTINEDLLAEMEKLREDAGIPISTQIELRLRGYEIRRLKAEKGEKSQENVANVNTT